MKNRPKSDSTHGSWNRWAMVGGVFLIAMIAVFWHFNSIPPRLDASDDAAKTIDAMFTALTSKQPSKLEDCMRRLEMHLQKGNLGSKAFSELNQCRELAISGSWDKASRRVYWLVYEQR